MKRLRALLAGAVTLAAMPAAVPVYAQVVADAAPESGQALPLWEVGVIGGAVSTPAYPGAGVRNARAMALPYLIYRGKVVRSEQGGVDARLFHNDSVELNIGAAASLPADSDDVAIRRGMPDLGTLLEFGPQLKIKLAQPAPGSSLRLDAPLRAVIEVRGGWRNQGAVFEPRLVYDVRRKGWSFSANLGLLYGSTKLNQYFYGVAPQYATAFRPAYDAQSGHMLTRLGLSATYDLTDAARLYVFSRYDSYAGAANRASRLFERGQGVSAGLAVAWTLAESRRGGSN
ncbi:MAG TPA: MipA/OmpV family protein [Burkholderiaceae bacterium]